MATTETDLIATMIATLKAERDGWSTHLVERAERDAQRTVVSGQNYVVVCEGKGLRLQGTAAIPTSMKPGLPGISHFDRTTAAKVAKLRGAPYVAVAAYDVPERRISEIDALLSQLAA